MYEKTTFIMASGADHDNLTHPKHPHHVGAGSGTAEPV